MPQTVGLALQSVILVADTFHFLGVAGAVCSEREGTGGSQVSRIKPQTGSLPHPHTGLALSGAEPKRQEADLAPIMPTCLRLLTPRARQMKMESRRWQLPSQEGLQDEVTP